MILLVSCTYVNLQSSRYIKLINGYRNGFFRTDVIFSPWNHDAIAWTCFDGGIRKWVQPPFSRNVTTKIGKYFLNLLDKHFPQNHRLHRIFNRNSVKISYSCTKSMKTIIANHNKNILGKKPSINKSNCNCRNKEACPLNG